MQSLSTRGKYYLPRVEDDCIRRPIGHAYSMLYIPLHAARVQYALTLTLTLTLTLALTLTLTLTLTITVALTLTLTLTHTLTLFLTPFESGLLFMFFIFR